MCPVLMVIDPPNRPNYEITNKKTCSSCIGWGDGVVSYEMTC